MQKEKGKLKVEIFDALLKSEGNALGLRLSDENEVLSVQVAACCNVAPHVRCGTISHEIALFVRLTSEAEFTPFASKHTMTQQVRAV